MVIIAVMPVEASVDVVRRVVMTVSSAVSDVRVGTRMLLGPCLAAPEIEPARLSDKGDAFRGCRGAFVGQRDVRVLFRRQLFELVNHCVRELAVPIEIRFAALGAALVAMFFHSSDAPGLAHD